MKYSQVFCSFQELGALEESLRRNETNLNEKRRDFDQQKRDNDKTMEKERCNLQVS